MGSIDIIGGGIDVATIVSQLMRLERQPVVRMQDQINSMQSRINAFQTFNTRLSALSNSVNMMLYNQTTAPIGQQNNFANNIFSRGTATSSNENVLTATASSSASHGSYSITVANLAQAQTTISETSFANGADSVIGAGTITLQFGPAGADQRETSFDVGEGTTLRGLQDAINNAEAGVTASIITDANGSRLMITSNETGTANQFTINFSVESGETPLNFNATPSQAAQDARMFINGVLVTNSTNTVDALDGVTINLRGQTLEGQTVRLDVGVNSNEIVSRINEMISAYNAVNSFISAQSAFNHDRETAGVLSGDATLRNVQSTLQSIFAPTSITAWDPDNPNAIRSMSQLGISFERDGSLRLDEARLREALSQDFEGVESFLMGNGSGGGLLTNMSEALSGLTNPNNGPVQSAMDGLNNNIRGIQQNIESFEIRLEAREAMLLAQFHAADQALRMMNVTMGSINQALMALNNNVNNR
jgi:flagellar hook-associated protein 2